MSMTNGRQVRMFVEQDSDLAKAGDAYLQAQRSLGDAKLTLKTTERTLLDAMRQAKKRQMVHGGKRFTVIVIDAKERVSVA